MKVVVEYVRVAGEISSKALQASSYRGTGNSMIVHMITSTHHYISLFGTGCNASSISMPSIAALTAFAASLAAKLVKVALDHTQRVIFAAAHSMYLKRHGAVQLEEHTVAVPERSSSIIASAVQYLEPAIQVNPQLSETVRERVEDILLMLLDCMASGVLNNVRTSQQLVEMLRDARYTRDFMLPALQKSCSCVFGSCDTSASPLISDAAGELELLASCAFARPVVAKISRILSAGFTGSPMFFGALSIRDYVPQVPRAISCAARVQHRSLWSSISLHCPSLCSSISLHCPSLCSSISLHCPVADSVRPCRGDSLLQLWGVAGGFFQGFGVALGDRAALCFAAAAAEHRKLPAA
jgi:hypothetical protein